jgi:DNA-binding MarR family transcriptional regulator
MPPSARAIACKICDLMPLIERAISSELRRGNQYVTPSHLGLLAALVRGPFTLSGLSEILAVSLPTMSNSITTFVERGWVKRKRSAYDRRFIEIELTRKGREALGDIRKRVKLLLTAQLASLPPSKRQELKIALKTLLQTFQYKAENSAGSSLTKANGARPSRVRRGRRAEDCLSS